MKRKITLLSAGFMLCLGIVRAQVPCADDPNGFVASKNVGSTSSYQLKIGFEEKAAQTYDFNGTGKIMSVRVYGTHQTMTFSGVPLKVSVYNVDANGKPRPVPELIPENEEEKKTFDGALRRRQLRLILAKKMRPEDATELKALFTNE